MTRSIARSLCDSWASCLLYWTTGLNHNDDRRRLGRGSPQIHYHNYWLQPLSLTATDTEASRLAMALTNLRCCSFCPRPWNDEYTRKLTSWSVRFGLSFWLSTISSTFLLRDAIHKRGLCRHAVSVCLSVCLSCSWIMSKRINISSKFFHHLVASPF